MLAVTGLRYCINTESEGFQVIVVGGGGGWHNTVASHKKISNTDNLVLG